MTSFKTTLLLPLLFATACSSLSLNKNGQAWEELKNSEIFQKEKATYFSRLGDRRFCWDTGLDDFLTPNSPKPDEKCIYPASKLVVKSEEGFLSHDKVLGQNFGQLKILQVLSNGFVVVSPQYWNDQFIFVYKSNETNLVDGSFLDRSQNFQLYEYAGTFSYTTILGGAKTVYSFRKVNQKLGDVRKEIKYYDPLREFEIENQLWNNLGEYPKNSSSLNP